MNVSHLCKRFAVIALTSILVQGIRVANVSAQQSPASSQTAVDESTDKKLSEELSGEGVQASVQGHNLTLQLDSNTVNSGKATVPRLCAPIRSISWKGHPDAALKFVPEPDYWVFSWKKAPSEFPVIEVVFDSPPVLPGDCPAASPSGDGSVMLHASQASTFGEKLRFEPQWYKNTVGYWTIPTDYATWELTIDQPGTFTVAVLQGCGSGQGGSDASITLTQGHDTKAELPFQTVDTRHFQNFRWNHLGAIEVSDAGTYQLRISPKRIAKNALFDVRMVHLVRQAK